MHNKPLHTDTYCYATEQPKIGQGKAKKEIKSNITDNESAKMTTSKGMIQGYNGVATVDQGASSMAVVQLGSQY